MAISFVGVGSVTHGVGNITPVAPAYSAPATLLLCTGIQTSSSSTLTTPGGWTKQNSTVNGAQAGAFALYDSTGGATIPTVNWNGTDTAWGVVLVFSGVDPSLTASFTPGDRTTSQTRDIAMPSSSRTPAADGALVIAMGHKRKDSTSNGTSWGTPSTFSGSGTIATAVSDAQNGTVDAFVIDYWIQNTATTIAANGTITGTVTNTTAFNAQCFLFGLAAATGGVVPYPPMNQGGMIVQVAG